MILKYLELEGYDTTNFKDFTFNDIHTMANTKQLDMLVEKPKKENACIVSSLRTH